MIQSRMIRARFFTCVCQAALLVLLVAGCAQWNVPKKIPLPGSDDKPRTPTRLTALWTDTVLVEAGVAGFGGRLMFYGDGSDDPIVVEGELTVFGYDDSAKVKPGTVPARKFVFRAEELKKHYSKSTLGHSYSFWIPWEKVGGPQRQISLITRFKSKQGGVVMSEMTRHLLPGVTPTDDGSQPAIASGASPLPPVSQAAHQAPAAASGAVLDAGASSNTASSNPLNSAASNPSAAGRAMSTTTITLSEALGSAVQKGTAEADAVPGATASQPAPARTPAAVAATPAPADPGQIRSLVQDVVREAMADQQQSPDRFGRHRRRARIEPRLPPTRDPAATPRLPAKSPSGLTSLPPGVSSIQAARATGVLESHPQQMTPPAR